MDLGTNTIYLDANATLPLKQEAKEAIIALMAETGNPSSIHRFGRHLKSQVETARDKIADRLGVYPAQVIFTSSGTEANNLALHYYKDKKVLISAIEHLSVMEFIPEAAKIPVLSKGIIDLEWLEQELRTSKYDLISVMYANNETGIVQPIEEIVNIAKSYTIKVHTDAVQGFGKVDIDFNRLGVNYLSLSAHKVGGPQGVGVLIVSETAPLDSLLKGGGQERRRRAGTENSLGIIGFGAAVEGFQSEEWDITSCLRDHLEEALHVITPEALVIDQAVRRLPNTTLLRMPRVENQKQLMAFDLKGIAVSAGSACSSGKVQQSHVLAAMGLNTSDIIRVSFGPHNSEEDVNIFIQAWHELYLQYKNREEK